MVKALDNRQGKAPVVKRDTPMATQIELATRTLFDPAAVRVQNIKLFPGSSREVTPEQMAGQVNLVISQLLSGDFDELSFDGE